VHAAPPEGDRIEAKAAHAPAAAEARRPRISLAEVIFRILCLIIAAFFILLFGLVGGVLYLTS
jgi:hypothetical protein